MKDSKQGEEVGLNEPSAPDVSHTGRVLLWLLAAAVLVAVGLRVLAHVTH